MTLAARGAELMTTVRVGANEPVRDPEDEGDNVEPPVATHSRPRSTRYRKFIWGVKGGSTREDGGVPPPPPEPAKNGQKTVQKITRPSR